MMAKKSIDRRAARSRAKLHEALLCLMAQRSYETITVEDICDRASVSRSTFYSHYAGKDDLIRNWLRQLRELVVYQATDQAMPGCPRGGFAFSLTMLEHARDHVHLHKALGDRAGTIVQDAIRQILADVIRRELAATACEIAKGAMPRELVVQYVVGAYMAVVRWWLDGGAKLAPQHVDAMFQRLAAEGIAAHTSFRDANRA